MDLSEQTFRFDCLFYYVTDLDRAVEFYSTTFGMRLKSRDVVARFDVDGVLFELVPRAAVARGAANARLTLRVNDISAAAAALTAKAVRVSPPRAVSNGSLFEVWDPDGNEIVIWQALR